MDKPLVFVVWNDSQDHGSPWVDEKTAEEFGDVSCIIKSVGFLVRKTDKYITLGADWEEDGKDFGRVTKIPTSMLISCEEIAIPTLVKRSDEGGPN